MKKKSIRIVVTAVGLVLIAAGLYLVKSVAQPEGILRALPYVMIGVGCGTFGSGMGEILRAKSVKNHPEIEKQMEIERTDERNVAIANRAKAKAYDLMIFVFSALMLAFALMGVDMAAVLLLVFAYLLVIGYSIYCRCKLDKEM